MTNQAPRIGTRIYNHGDMANVPHFGEIVAVNDDEYGSWITVKVETDPGATYRYTIATAQIDDVFLGHSGTRIVTEESYNVWRTAKLAAFQAAVA
jgi:hypothetical protein